MTVKKHAIIPVFIPHLGCPHACVFCDQNQITARNKAPSSDEVISFVDEWLSTLDDVETVELAFYGGSFTAIPISMQTAYLEIAKSYKDKGLIDKIHLSTRPDCIDKEILENLEAFSVDTIELGVQSFDENVLRVSERGHDVASVYTACDLIKEREFELGIQLMIGLPMDSYESCIRSAEETVKIKPNLARLYPTLVLPRTKLYSMYEKGEYIPLDRDEAVRRCAAMYRILDDAGIYIMRVGLKSTDVINSARLGEINSGTYHPAFRQLVEDEITKERISCLLDGIDDHDEHDGNADAKCVIIKTHPSWASSISGHNGSNKEYFNEKYPHISFRQENDEGIKPGRFELIVNDKAISYN